MYNKNQVAENVSVTKTVKISTENSQVKHLHNLVYTIKLIKDLNTTHFDIFSMLKQTKDSVSGVFCLRC